jgi:hypothetical protein
MKTQLLCTFTTQDRLKPTIDLIISCHDVLFDKIYIFNNQKDISQLICTYNIPNNQDNFIEGMDTIALHRKKQSNTLYTINALNEVIRDKNNGVLDKTFPITWSEFQNSLLLVNEQGLNIIPTRIYKIINTETWNNENL